METKTSGALPAPLALQGVERREQTLGAEDRRGHTAVGGEGPSWMVRIDVFFKKKIITIYLHPGGQGRGEETGWGGSIYKGHRRGRGWRWWRPGEGAKGAEVLIPPHPCPSFSSLPTTS